MNRFVKEKIFDDHDSVSHIRIQDDSRLRKVEKRRRFKLTRQNFDFGLM